MPANPEFLYLLRIAYHTAKFSNDPKTKNGAVLVLPNETLVVGYNRVLGDPAETPERFQAPEKYDWVIHAEEDAILNAAKHGNVCKGAVLFATWAACTHCAKVMVGAGIKTVVRHRHEAQDAHESWVKSVAKGDEILKSAGVQIIDVWDPLGVTVLFNGEERHV